MYICAVILENHHILKVILTLFRMGIFGAAHRWEGRGQKGPPSLPKICHTYPTMMKLCTVILYLKKIQKNIRITWYIPWVLLTSAFFLRKSENFFISRNTDINCILIRNFYFFVTFLESLNIFLINLVKILMMPAKMITPGHLKIAVFWNKGYDVIKTS